MHGPILVHFQAHRQTVNSANYCEMLWNELKPAICKKRRGMLSTKVLPHHDNAHHSSSDSRDSATTGLRTSSTSSLQPGFGAKRFSHLRSSEGSVVRSQIHFQWGSEGSCAHLASKAAEKLLLRRNTETSWMIWQMHCVARGLCRKMICKIAHSYFYWSR